MMYNSCFKTLYSPRNTIIRWVDQLLIAREFEVERVACRVGSFEVLTPGTRSGQGLLHFFLSSPSLSYLERDLLTLSAFLCGQLSNTHLMSL